MTLAEWNVLKVGDKIVADVSGRELTVEKVSTHYEVHRLYVKGETAMGFWSVTPSIYSLPTVHYVPRAVVSWCPEEVAEKLNLKADIAAGFLDAIEDDLEETMTKAGWKFILSKAAERGWEEVDG